MTTPEIKTFQGCLDIAKETKGNNHLMLGNGFSVELFPDIFNYKQLAERIKSPRIKKLFESMKTSDFEFVMYKLTEALKVIELYPDSTKLYDEINNDLNELKETLIKVIQESHPKNPTAISEEQYLACRHFLSHFESGNKYTFNYDLLMYWVYMHFLDDNKRKLKCDDGFRHPDDDQSIVTWEIGQEHRQNISYIHGSMHIFTNGSDIEKYTWINSGKTISEQLKESIDQGVYPIFISEGTKEHKVSRIHENSYLGRSFSSLKSIAGNLFIFGHSIRDEDDHVFEIINKKSKVKNIFISIYGDANSEGNQKIFSKINSWKNQHTKNYIFYSSDSANVWGKNNA